MPIIKRSCEEPAQLVRTESFTAQIENIYPGDPTVAPFSVYLPIASGLNGRDIYLYNQADINTMTVVPSGSDTIGGQANLVLDPRESVTLTSDNVSDWIPFGQASDGPSTATATGLILTSPDGTQYNVAITNAGEINTTAI